MTAKADAKLGLSPPPGGDVLDTDFQRSSAIAVMVNADTRMLAPEIESSVIHASEIQLLADKRLAQSRFFLPFESCNFVARQLVGRSVNVLYERTPSLNLTRYIYFSQFSSSSSDLDLDGFFFPRHHYFPLRPRKKKRSSLPSP